MQKASRSVPAEPNSVKQKEVCPNTRREHLWSHPKSNGEVECLFCAKRIILREEAE